MEGDEEGESEMDEEMEDEEESEEDQSENATNLDPQIISKQLRSILNKVSEGNIDPMFKQLSEVLDGMECGEIVWQEYSKIFCQLTLNLEQNMNVILSVNCVFVSAI